MGLQKDPPKDPKLKQSSTLPSKTAQDVDPEKHLSTAGEAPRAASECAQGVLFTDIHSSLKTVVFEYSDDEDTRTCCPILFELDCDYLRMLIESIAPHMPKPVFLPIPTPEGCVL